MTYRQRLTLFCIGVLLLVSCTSSDFVQPDGSIAFDVQIRIAAPVNQPSPTPRPTIAPTDDPTPTQELVTSVPPGWGRVTTLQLNVRSAPGVNNPDIGDLFIGNVVFIIGRTDDGSWLQVEDENGALLGWVSAQYVEEYRG